MCVRDCVCVWFMNVCVNKNYKLQLSSLWSESCKVKKKPTHFFRTLYELLKILALKKKKQAVMGVVHMVTAYGVEGQGGGVSNVEKGMNFLFF